MADTMKVAMIAMINKKKYSKQQKYIVGEWAPFIAFGLPSV